MSGVSLRCCERNIGGEGLGTDMQGTASENHMILIFFEAHDNLGGNKLMTLH